MLAENAVAAAIEVTARYETIGTASTGAATVQQEVLEDLAIDRSLEAAVGLPLGAQQNLAPPGLDRPSRKIQGGAPHRSAVHAATTMSRRAIT